MASPLVAWVEIPYPDSDYSMSIAIVFATSEGRAKIKAARYHGQDPRSESVYGIKRAPEFDCDSPGPVKSLTLLDNGWWLTCHGCNKKGRI
jgi:hypothetical protein